MFVFVRSFTSSVSLSTCTNKLPLTFYLQIHDELKLTSPCRIVASSSKGLQRLFAICCYTHLVVFCLVFQSSQKFHHQLATPVQRSTYQVVCQAGGFPRPVINWRRVGMPLPAGRTEVNQGTLKIKNLNPADSGSYECTATNTMGTKKATINVAVQQLKLAMFFFFSYQRVLLVTRVPLYVLIYV